MRARLACLVASIVVMTAPTFGAVAAAQENAERIDLFGLVSSAPLPAGYQATRQDFQPPGGPGSTLILLSTAANKSRVRVTIEKQKLTTKEQKVAAFKAAVNGIHGVFTKQGYRTVEMEHPDSQMLDPDKRLDLRLKLQKEGKVLAIDAEIFFSDQAYTVWSVTTDQAEREKLKAWIGTVRAK